MYHAIDEVELSLNDTINGIDGSKQLFGRQARD